MRAEARSGHGAYPHASPTKRATQTPPETYPTPQIGPHYEPTNSPPKPHQNPTRPLADRAARNGPTRSPLYEAAKPIGMGNARCLEEEVEIGVQDGFKPFDKVWCGAVEGHWAGGMRRMARISGGEYGGTERNAGAEGGEIGAAQVDGEAGSYSEGPAKGAVDDLVTSRWLGSKKQAGEYGVRNECEASPAPAKVQRGQPEAVEGASRWRLARASPDLAPGYCLSRKTSRLRRMARIGGVASWPLRDRRLPNQAGVFSPGR